MKLITHKSATYAFKLRRRVFRYRGGFRWIVTDATQEFGTVLAHGEESSTAKARAQAGIKILELEKGQS